MAIISYSVIIGIALMVANKKNDISNQMQMTMVYCEFKAMKW
jgi:hypothetical protein